MPLMLMYTAPVDPVALTGADQAVRSAANRYFGCTVRETAGAVAVVQIFDGITAAGTLLDTISLAANGSFNTWYPMGGIRTTLGVFVHIVSGTVEGSVRVA